jgi:hypothetical protein
MSIAHSNEIRMKSLSGVTKNRRESPIRRVGGGDIEPLGDSEAVARNERRTAKQLKWG